MTDTRVRHLRAVVPQNTPADQVTPVSRGEGALDEVNARLEQLTKERLDKLEERVVSTLDSFEARLKLAFAKVTHPEAAGASAPKEGDIKAVVAALENRLRHDLSAGSSELADDINTLLNHIEHGLAGNGNRLRNLRLRFRSLEVDPYGFDPVFSEQVAPLADFFLRRYFRTSVLGVHHIPKQGRALLVANHSGTVPWDGLMLTRAVKNHHPQRRDVRALAEDFVFHFPYLGVLINRLGHVRACQENAVRMLEEDLLVGVFPEGIKGIGKLYSQRYQLQRFGRGGFVRLALRTGTPIIPVAIVGAEEIHPMLAKITWLARNLGIPYFPITPTFPWLGPLGLIPLPSKWTIVFGQPIDFSSYGPGAISDHLLVNKLTEQVRHTIQQMVLETLSKRQSVWLG